MHVVSSKRMKGLRMPAAALLGLLGLMLACGQSPNAESALVQVRATLRPTFTPTSSLPTSTSTPMPTYTPLPATDTPPPTATPLPMDTPLPTDTPLPAATPLSTTTAAVAVEPTVTGTATRKPSAPTNTPVPPTATPNPYLLKDGFDAGLGAGWKAFLNYWRLDGAQWYWTGDGGVGGGGAVAHNCCASGGPAEDALMMYMGDGAEAWTDYRVQVQLLVPTDKGQWQGLWFRGQWEERTKKDTAQWVTGYYVMLGRNRTVKLLQLQIAEDCRDNACRNPENQYAFNNPFILHEQQVEGLELTRGVWHTLVVEVRGSQIKIWVDDVFAFEYVDTQAPFLQGTIGLKTFESEPVLYDNVVVTVLK